jgi:hypothetical protein
MLSSCPRPVRQPPAPGAPRLAEFISAPRPGALSVRGSGFHRNDGGKKNLYNTHLKQKLKIQND